MKPLTIALIGVGVIGASVAAIYVLKAKGIIANNENGGVRTLTSEEKDFAKAHLVDAINSGIVDSSKQFTTKDELLKKIGFTRDQYNAVSFSGINLGL